MAQDNRKFYCYLDDFNEITIIIPNRHYREKTKYRLLGNDEVIDLDIKERIPIGNETKLVCVFDAYIELRMIYHVVSDKEEKSMNSIRGKLSGQNYLITSITIKR